MVYSKTLRVTGMFCDLTQKMDKYLLTVFVLSCCLHNMHGLLPPPPIHGHPYFDPAKPFPRPLFGELFGNEFRFRDKIYLVVGLPMHQPEAALYCHRWGGRLASVPNEETRQFLKYAMAISFEQFNVAWIGVMKEGVHTAIQSLIDDERLYNSDCIDDPDDFDCVKYTAGPFWDEEVVEETCFHEGDCSNTTWVDSEGNPVNFFFWGDDQPTNGLNCVTLEVYDCQHHNGCQESLAQTERCAFDDDYQAICEKEECPPVMYPPDPANEVDLDEDWGPFLNLQTYCGPKYYRTVVNVCAMEYVGIENLRIAETETSTESCPVRRGHILEAEVHKDSCGGVEVETLSIPKSYNPAVLSNYFASGNFPRYIDPLVIFEVIYETGPNYPTEYLIYNFTIHGEIGAARLPKAGDVITRYRPIRLQSHCAIAVDILSTLEEEEILPHQTFQTVGLANGNGNFEITLGIYSDMAMNIPLTGDPPTIAIPAPLYIGITVTGDTNILQAIECFASNSNDFTKGDGVISYDFISNRCPSNNDIHVQENGVSNQVRLWLNTFCFVNDPVSVVYIHCQVKVCSTPLCGEEPCGTRRKRDVEKTQEDTETVSVGPIKLVYDKEQDNTPLGEKSMTSKDRKHTWFKPGYEPGDHCNKYNGWCSHSCDDNEKDEVVCSCPDGMELMRDAKTCADIKILHKEDTKSDSKKIEKSAKKQDSLVSLAFSESVFVCSFSLFTVTLLMYLYWHPKQISLRSME